MTINHNLQKLRKQNHLTQEQMAEKLAMSKNGYAKLERGESKLTVNHLLQIAKIFDMNEAELLKEIWGGGRPLVGQNTFCQYNNLLHEIEKLKLIITHKDDLLAQKDKEIELLRKLLEK